MTGGPETARSPAPPRAPGSGRRIALALCGSVLLNFALGGLYAFSTLIVPLQEALSISRAAAGAAFSVASAGFMLAMLAGGWLQARASAPGLAALAGGLAGCGLALAALVPGQATLLLGFGAGYGLANGIGYGLALRSLLAAWTGRPGLAAGLAVAAYALGGVVWSALLPELASPAAPEAALAVLAGANLLAGLAAALAYRTMHSGPEPAESATEPAAPATDPPPPLPVPMLRLWMSFFLVAAAGLALLGHAGALAPTAAAAAVAINLGNGLGRIAGGWLVDTAGARAVLTAAPVLLALALLGLLTGPVEAALVALLGLAGACYGAAAAGYPAALARVGGLAAFAHSYGRLFTAWGLAAMLGPAVAGALHDWTGGYGAALGLALAAALLGALLASGLRSRPQR